MRKLLSLFALAGTSFMIATACTNNTLPQEEEKEVTTPAEVDESLFPTIGYQPVFNVATFSDFMYLEVGVPYVFEITVDSMSNGMSWGKEISSAVDANGMTSLELGINIFQSGWAKPFYTFPSSVADEIQLNESYYIELVKTNFPPNGRNQLGVIDGDTIMSNNFQYNYDYSGKMCKVSEAEKCYAFENDGHGNVIPEKDYTPILEIMNNFENLEMGDVYTVKMMATGTKVVNIYDTPVDFIILKDTSTGSLVTQNISLNTSLLEQWPGAYDVLMANLNTYVWFDIYFMNESDWNAKEFNALIDPDSVRLEA